MPARWDYPRLALIVGGVALLLALALAWTRHDSPAELGKPKTRRDAQASALPPDARFLDTAHYRIASTADPQVTQRVAEAVETLRQAYVTLLPVNVARTAPMSLVLYRSREELHRFVAAPSWAEAIYRQPDCHAYPGEGTNPYHWMLHEAVHQLLVEGSGYRPARWANEGFAAYLGASRIVDGRLRPGTVSDAAYPIWWLRQYRLSGVFDADVEAGQLLPLAELIDSDAADVAGAINLHYVHYWSFVHFLMHGETGRYREGFLQLLATAGTRSDFERLIGPLPEIQAKWYGHVQGLVAAARAQRLDAVPDDR